MGTSTGTVSQQAAEGQQHPIVESITTTSYGTGTTHDLVLPDNVSEGDILMVFCCAANSLGLYAPNGWLDMFDFEEPPLIGGAFYKYAAGTESGTTVQFSTLSSTAFAAQICHLTSNASPDVGSEIEWEGDTNNMSCPPLSPTWGSFATLWINIFYAAMSGTYSSHPPAYADLVTVTTGLTTADARVYTCRLQNESSTENPGSWSFNSPLGKWGNFHIGFKGKTIL